MPSTPLFNLKPVAERDLKDLLAVYRDCEDFLALGPEPRATAAMVLADLEHSREQGGVFRGIYNPSGRLVGVIDLVPQGFAGDPTQAFISLLMIARPFQQQGLGAAVVATIEQELRQNPQVNLILSAVQVNNPAALRFWQRQGYRVSRGPKLQPDGTTTVMLQKSASR